MWPALPGSNFGVTRTNLLVRSEEFDSASWNNSAGARTITPNSVAAPDGLLTADTVAADGTTAPHFVSQSLTLSAVPYAYSVFAKAGTNNFLQLRLFNAFGGMWANFNLATGVVGTVGVTSGAAPTSSIQAYPNGWYRCTIIFTPTATTSSVAAYIVSSASATGSETNSLSTALYLWGAQLEVGSAVTPYIQSPSVFTSRASSGTYVGGNGLIQTATTNEARYDHDPISLIGKGLLLEEARTNLALRSEEFDNASWLKTNSTVTADGAISPDGTMDAYKIVSNSALLGFIVQSVSQTTATSYTWSVFAKAGEYSFCQLRITGTVVPSITRAYFNLATGTTTTTTNCTASITAFGNGWYKCSITYTTISAATALPRFYGQVDDADTVSDGTSGIYIWGAQMEAGAFATSYIPTTTATVTRAADISTSVATSVFESSWYRQDEGTVFVRAATFSTGTTLTHAISDGTFNESMYANFSGGNGFRGANVLDAGVPQATSISSFTGLVASDGVNDALAFQANNFGESLNGLATRTDNTGTIPTVDRLFIGSSWAGTGSFLNGTIRRLTYWPTRLGNEVLQRITQ
jgi:hypothetical protein